MSKAIHPESMTPLERVRANRAKYNWHECTVLVPVVTIHGTKKVGRLLRKWDYESQSWRYKEKS